VIHSIGTSFSVGYWTYVVNSVDSRAWLPDIGEMKACDSGNCVVINLTVRNDDTTSSTRPVVKLVDSAGREFSETDTWSDTQLGWLQQLNPGVSKRGYIYFDAPRGSYRLKVSGGYTSGVDALVNLSATERSAEAQAPLVQAYVPPVEAPTTPAVLPRYVQPVQDLQPVQSAPLAQAPVERPAAQAPRVEAPSVPTSTAPSDLLTVTVVKTKVVQHIDPQGHDMLFAKAYSKDSPDNTFSLICHTAKSSCTSLREGEDYVARILQAGDPYYDSAYSQLKGAIIVRIDNSVFALMREKKLQN
jgi:hypothetical protein